MHIFEHLREYPDLSFGVFGTDAEGQILPDASASCSCILDRTIEEGEIFQPPDGFDNEAGQVIQIQNRWVELSRIQQTDNLVLWITIDITSKVWAEHQLKRVRQILHLYPIQSEVLYFSDSALHRLAVMNIEDQVRTTTGLARILAEAEHYELGDVATACRNALDSDLSIEHLERIYHTIEEFLIWYHPTLLELEEVSQRARSIDLDLTRSVFKQISSSLGVQASLDIEGTPRLGHRSLQFSIIPLLEHALTHPFASTPYQEPDSDHHMTLQFTNTSHSWQISLFDRRPGFDPAKLQTMVTECGLLSPEKVTQLEPFELLALIATDHKHHPNPLAKIKHALKPLGGELEIRAHLTQGTTITVKTPKFAS